MEENYNPSGKEVLKEIHSMITSKFTKKSLKEFAFSSVKITRDVLALTYAAPTMYRKVKNNKEGETSLAEWVGGFTGLAIGLAADVGTVLEYHYNLKQSHPNLWLIPVATNLASGGYEIGRKLYKDAKQRALDKRNGKNLETTLNTDSIKE